MQLLLLTIAASVLSAPSPNPNVAQESAVVAQSLAQKVSSAGWKAVETAGLGLAAGTGAAFGYVAAVRNLSPKCKCLYDELEQRRKCICVDDKVKKLPELPIATDALPLEP
jgi:hypothetical protein